MASVYPGALDAAPNHSSWAPAGTVADLDHLADMVRQVQIELGVAPSAGYADVIARLDALSDSGLLANRSAAAAVPGQFYLSTDVNGGTLHYSDGTSWLQVAPGAGAQPGTRLGSATLTADYSIFGQGAPTTFTDIGLSVAVGSVQALAYDVDLDVSLAVAGGATWVAGNVVNLQVRIVDSAVTKIGASVNVRFRSEATASQSIIENRRIRFQVPASHAATTWKVQARQAAASPTGLTGSVVSAGPALATPTAGYQTWPTLLTATTVG